MTSQLRHLHEDGDQPGVGSEAGETPLQPGQVSLLQLGPRLRGMVSVVPGRQQPLGQRTHAAPRTEPKPLLVRPAEAVPESAGLLARQRPPQHVPQRDHHPLQTLALHITDVTSCIRAEGTTATCKFRPPWDTSVRSPFYYLDSTSLACSQV